MNEVDIAALTGAILERLEADRVTARQALDATHEAATHSESKAENKYDTRGLEAAYLADGQRRRLHEIELALAAYRNLPARRERSETVRLGALVLLAGEQGERWLFLGPDGAGLRLGWGGREVLVITPRAPLGQALLGGLPGDEIRVRVNGAEQLYELLEVY